MRCLLDVNVLVALTFPTHAFHDRTQKWFRLEKRRPWASCALAQGGYLRSAVHMIGKSHEAIAEALEMLEGNCLNSDHEFWPVEASLLDLGPRNRRRLIGVGQVTDMQLLVMAYERKALLVTFDKGMRELARGTRFEDSVFVL